MQTIQKTQYHCAELRRSVPVIQRIEWVSGIGQDDAEPVVLAEACALASRCQRGRELPADGRRVGRLDGRPGSPSRELGRLAYCFSSRTM